MADRRSALRAGDGSACAEFRGKGPTITATPAVALAALGIAGRRIGHIFTYKGDDSGFVAERE